MKKYNLQETHDTSFIYSRFALINKLQKYANEYNFKIGLFGSYSRNEPNHNSDIDLLIFEDGLVLKDNCNRNGYEFKKRLERELKKDVSINFWNNLKQDVESTALIDLITLYPNSSSVKVDKTIISANPLD